MKTIKSDLIKVDYISKNRSSQAFKPIGIVLHETATVNATARREQFYFDRNKVGASAHLFIDHTEAIQCIPFDEKAWHACEPANSKFIGVEMCNFSMRTKNVRVYARTVLICAHILKELGISTVTKENLMSHDEVRKKWKKTSHVDPTAYLKAIGKDMDMFRAAVQRAIKRIK